MESKILALALYANYYHKLKSLELEEYLTPHAKVLLDCVSVFFQRDPEASFADKGLLKDYIKAHYKNHYDLLADILDNLEAVESKPNLFENVKDFKLEGIADRLSNAILDKDKEKIAYYTAKYEEIGRQAEDDIKESRMSFMEILEETEDEYSLKIYPKSLNTKVGGINRGSHVIVFARPEVGKTAWIITQMVETAKNGHRVLYLGNEDPIKQIIKRTAACLLKRSVEQLRKINKSKVDKALDKKGFRNIRFRQITPGIPSDIIKYVNKYKPDLLIVDQILNLRMGGDGKTQNLDKAVSFLRPLGLKNDMAVISVTQAGESAHDALLLNDTDIHYSNTDVSGQADLLLGIGANDSYKESNQRCLNVIKNKNNGWHGQVTCKIIPEISYYKDIA